MKKTVKPVEIKITVADDGVEVAVVGNKWNEQLFADFLGDGAIPTLAKILEWMEVPDDLKAKLYGRWVEQIGKRLTKLDFDNLDD